MTMTGGQLDGKNSTRRKSPTYKYKIVYKYFDHATMMVSQMWYTIWIKHRAFSYLDGRGGTAG